MVTTASEREREAEEAVAGLREALGAVGITLPSLWVDPVSSASREPGPPLVELGRCNVETALRLAAVLRRVEGR
ncbi:hypothetical protein [Streptomyces sp. GC420]|uniref:hypothetical protein n=1 Tax=Streptomyces sp. GC420 TaxID=2697568 RepID=UPI0014152FDA|nr:hypothetical protein [Streptomyces sp. GC420]NBM20789.1 hypothetical protein [Streptomyces sp. GC420]